MDDLDPPLGSYFSRQVRRASRFVLPRRGPEGTVVGGGLERVDAGYSVERTRFPYVAIELVIGGTGEVELSGRVHRLTGGSIFTYGPGVPHRIRTDPRAPLVKYFADASPTAAGDFERAGLEVGELTHTARPGEIMALFDLLIAHGGRGGGASAAICDHLFAAIVLLAADSAVPASSLDSPSLATWQSARALLEREALTIPSLTEAARRCGVTGEHLCRIFRRYERRTPYDLLVQIKMRHAASLLEQPGLSIAEVGRRIGYDDPFHFSRVFKRKMGVSPSRFRTMRAG